MLVISDRELDLGPILVGFADFGLRVVGRIGDLSFFFFPFHFDHEHGTAE